MSNTPKKEENGVFTNVKNAATNAANTLTGAVANVASNINKTANAAVNAVVNTAAKGANAVANTAANGANTFVSSLVPFNEPSNNKPANNKPANNRPANNRPMNMFANNKPANNKPANNKPANNNPLVNAINEGVGASPALIVFITLLLIFMILYTFFSDQIKIGYENLVRMIRNWLGMPSVPDVQAEIVPMDGTVATLSLPPPPIKLPVDTHRGPDTSAIVEKVLPLQSGAKEVFNVATNDYTYYDAEPLCKALGAELANYNQVQKSWEKGADWCNYGWVKGQMAVYPTQKETYEQVQNGPADQRGSCGTVGVNGGYFDNPELKLGVNCYGNKPDQSTHNQPSNSKSPDELEELDKINKYREESGDIPINPYNKKKWSSV